MKKVWNFMLGITRPTLGLLLAVAFLGILYLFKLSTLVPGVSESEIEVYNSSFSLSLIFENIVNAPYKFAIYLSTNLTNSIFGLRIVSVIVATMSVGVFYLLSKKLLSKSMPVLATILFASTTAVLHAARMANFEIMLLSILAIVASGYYLRFHKSSNLAWILAATAIGLSLYTPGIIFFVAIAAIFQFRHARKTFEQLSPITIISTAVIISVILAPLAISLFRDSGQIMDLIGLPDGLSSIDEILRNIAQAFLSIFIIAKPDPNWHVGRQPILDMFTIVLIVYGFIALLKKIKLERFWTFIGAFVLGIVWVGLTGEMANLIIALPFLYIVAGIGLETLYKSWTSVFPRNPIARGIGYSLILATVALCVNFHIQRYFNAWSNSSETETTFSYQIPNN